MSNNNASVLIYAPVITNRLRYTFDLLFSSMSGISVVYSADKVFFTQHTNAKINYSFERISDELIFIRSHSLLFEKDIQKINIESVFKTTPLNLCDIPAMVFLCVSRYEEYNVSSSELDHHGRFTAAASFAGRYGFLHQPVVNIWLEQLRVVLRTAYPNLIFSSGEYKFQPTFDIDIAWQFKNRSVLRSGVGLIKDILKFRFDSILQRIKSFGNNFSDVYDTFEMIQGIDKSGTKAIYFWLLGNYGRFDKNIHWRNPALKELILEKEVQNHIGIHPSYKTNIHKRQLALEIHRLESLSGKKITHSRQHFLKLSMPDTYRNLIKAGITDDYTMGYADDIGFRAGIATPFYWFDLERDEVTSLKIHPFQVMDVSLKNYLKLTPEQALERVKIIIDDIKAVNGEFCTLWHNTSLSETTEWRRWSEVYIEIVNYALQKDFLKNENNKKIFKLPQ